MYIEVLGVTTKNNGRYIAKKPTKKSKWNTLKYSNNPKEGKKKGKK